MPEPDFAADSTDDSRFSGSHAPDDRLPSHLDEAAAPILLDDIVERGRDQAPVGPGILESLLWILGFFVIELAGSAVWTFGVMGVHTLKTGQVPHPNDIQTLLVPYMSWMVGTIKFAEVLAAVVAIRLRFGRHAFRLTGFRSVHPVHAVILGLAVLPTAFLAGQSFALFQGFWDQLSELAPGLRALNDFSSIEAVQAMAKSTPLAVLVLIIAAFPALNEEFVFRAAIGRGLLARYGLVAGIALSSMFFAAVHLSPVHAAALIPLAVLMHVGYYASGSIWAPVGVHFLNNALSVGLMKLATVDPNVGGLATDVTEAPFSPLLFGASAVCVAVTIWLLMSVRIRWQLPDGREWQPARTGVEAPPVELHAVRHLTVPPVAVVATAATCYALYPAAVVAGIFLQQR